MTTTHLAAVCHAVGAPLKVEQRATPKPGPNEVLIEVRAIGMNIIDKIMRDMAFMTASHPAVFGFDIGGVVLSVGPGVPPSLAQAGTRVAAISAAFTQQGRPDYGAFQERVLVPVATVAPIPDAMGFADAATLGMATFTAYAGLEIVGVPRDARYRPADDRQGLLVWGATSSVGTLAVQLARSMGFVVYATASPQHHEYVKSLGATRVFDYRDAAGVEDAVVQAARADGLTFQHAYLATGSLASCQNIVKALKGEGTGYVASAPAVSPDAPVVEGVEVVFVVAAQEEDKQKEQMAFYYNTWLRESLQTGTVVPSPKVRVVEGGLEAVNEALETLAKGVSCTKLVVELGGKQ
ncbi:GroES-like protein [Xylariaceae sp. FL0016]|nr:GroES-like protein [Xylariaceae sp. FL0016]